MRITKPFKFLGFLALVVTVSVACTTASEGPSAEQECSTAIADAKAANKKAKAVGYEWRDTGKIIKKAEAAMKDGKYEDCVKLANTARAQAENAVAQRESELNRLRAEGIIGGGVITTTAQEGQYQVVNGDNLWDISGKPEIYNNPYQWPLIFKANSDKIKDADLIFPGQVFDIDTSPSSADAAAAVQHARTRGSWSVGVVEDSDRAFLGK